MVASKTPSSNLTPDMEFKYIVVGPSGVGKSCFMERFTTGKLLNTNQTTIGVEFGTRVITLPERNLNIKIRIWDTAGQETFRSITHTYYRDSTVAIVMYSINSIQTFRQVKRFFQDIDRLCSPNILKVLIGNKLDTLKFTREVGSQDGLRMAHQCGALFMEVSNIANLNVDDVFLESAEKVVSRLNEMKSTDAKYIGVKYPNRKRPFGIERNENCNNYSRYSCVDCAIM